MIMCVNVSHIGHDWNVGLIFLVTGDLINGNGNLRYGRMIMELLVCVVNSTKCVYLCLYGLIMITD